MRKILIAFAASAALPILALGQTPRNSLVSSGASNTPSSAKGNVLTLDHCTVRPLPVSGESAVPAQEAGVLTEIKVAEGTEVHRGDLLARIDDKLAQKQFENAQAEWKAAKQKYETNIDIEVARAASETSKFEYQKNYEAVYGSPAIPASPGRPAVPAKAGVAGSVPETELNRLKFQWKRADLAIEQGLKDQIVNGHTADAKKAEMESAQEQINRRQVLAPIDGVVQSIAPHQGEYVKPGDTIMRLIRIDRLKAEGYVKVSEYEPNQIMNRPVTLKVMIAEKEHSFPGKIVYYDPEVQREREYLVRAEIDNSQRLLRPGMAAKMEIQLR